MADKKKVFTAHLGPVEDSLIGEGENQSVARLREIKVIDGETTLKTFKAAANETDIRAQLDKNGYIVQAWDGDQISVSPKPMDGVQKTTLGCFAIMALAILLLFVGCGVAMNSASKPSEATERDAIYACKTFAKKQLKSPSSAKFSGESASGSGSGWSSRGVVESQNSFGAMIQTRYSCTLSYAKSTETWTGSARLNE